MDSQIPLSRVGKKEISGAEHTRQKPKQPDPEDFRKMMDDESDNRDGGSDRAIAKEHKADVPISPFDLAAEKLTKGKQAPFAMMTGKELEASTDLIALEEATPKQMPKQEMSDMLGQERADLSYVNPAAMAVQGSENIGIQSQSPAQGIDRAGLQALVEQLVEKLLIVKRGGETDTVLTLKQPPVLAGSELVVTKYDNAQKEFNIAFSNLSPDGKRLLDLHANQLALDKAIKQAGEDYAVHIVVVTTEPYEKRLQTFHEGNTKGFRDQQEDQSGDQPGGGNKRGRQNR